MLKFSQDGDIVNLDVTVCVEYKVEDVVVKEKWVEMRRVTTGQIVSWRSQRDLFDWEVR